MRSANGRRPLRMSGSFCVSERAGTGWPDAREPGSSLRRGTRMRLPGLVGEGLGGRARSTRAPPASLTQRGAMSRPVAQALFSSGARPTRRCPKPCRHARARHQRCQQRHLLCPPLRRPLHRQLQEQRAARPRCLQAPDPAPPTQLQWHRGRGTAPRSAADHLGGSAPVPGAACCRRCRAPSASHLPLACTD